MELLSELIIVLSFFEVNVVIPAYGLSPSRTRASSSELRSPNLSQLSNLSRKSTLGAH